MGSDNGVPIVTPLEFSSTTPGVIGDENVDEAAELEEVVLERDESLDDIVDILRPGGDPGSVDTSQLSISMMLKDCSFRRLRDICIIS